MEHIVLRELPLSPPPLFLAKEPIDLAEYFLEDYVPQTFRFTYLNVKIHYVD